MRSSRLIVLLSLVTIAPLGWAQKQVKTQAEQDGFAGPVKSVATIVEQSNVPWQQPNGPVLVMPVWCHDCTYSPEGYRTKSGTLAGGEFVGEDITLHRNANGRVTELIATDIAHGQLTRHTVIGPFGKTEESFYQDGKLQVQNTFRYDLDGHLTEEISTDATGEQVGRTLTTWTKDDWTDRTGWGKNQQVQMRETFDPAKDEQHFTSFDASGNVALNWTYAHGQVHQFWAAADDTQQYGAAFADFDDKANPIAFHCHNRVCEAAKIHYEYADAARRNPASAEWRDASGNLLYGVYYTYRFDANGNWSHRELSVWNANLGARTPYETDDRLISYW